MCITYIYIYTHDIFTFPFIREKNSERQKYGKKKSLFFVAFTSTPLANTHQQKTGDSGDYSQLSCSHYLKELSLMILNYSWNVNAL